MTVRLEKDPDLLAPRAGMPISTNICCPCHLSVRAMAPQDPPDHPDHLDRMAHPAIPDHPDETATLDPRDLLAHPDHRASLVVLARRVRPESPDNSNLLDPPQPASRVSPVVQDHPARQDSLDSPATTVHRVHPDSQARTDSAVLLVSLELPEVRASRDSPALRALATTARQLVWRQDIRCRLDGLLLRIEAAIPKSLFSRGFGHFWRIALTALICNGKNVLGLC